MLVDKAALMENSIRHSAVFAKQPAVFAYVLQSSRISQKSGGGLIERCSLRKEWISCVFYCFRILIIAQNLGTTGPIQVGFAAKCTSQNQHFNQIGKLKMLHVRLQTDSPRSHHKWFKPGLSRIWHKIMFAVYRALPYIAGDNFHILFGNAV